MNSAQRPAKSTVCRYALLLLLLLPVCQAVAQVTETTVTSSQSTVTLGDTVTFTATVFAFPLIRQPTFALGTPTGLVTFFDGATPLGSGTLALVSGNGQATFSTSLLSASGSPHAITATYQGDIVQGIIVFASSTSPPISQTVTPRSSTSGVVLNPATVVVGQPSTITATVTDGGTSTPPGTPDTFAATGAPATGRTGFTSTLFGNGLVLVAGGTNGVGTVLQSAEIYSVSGAAFTATGNLNAARTGAVAVLLPNGKILVAGGSSDGTANGALNTAELFDPNAGTFTATGTNMTAARLGATATLLNNGQVLVAGGANSGGVLNSAELYDPVANTFTATGNLNTARTGATATLLGSGQVLIAGGSSDGTVNGALNTAELFNAGAFTAIASLLSAPRWQAAAALLLNGNVLIAGGENSGGALTSADLYNPGANTFGASAHQMAQARVNGAAVALPNGMVLLAGGVTPASTTAELYDADSDKFDSTGSLQQSDNGLVATLLNNGQVLAVGLTSGGTPTSDAELYSPSFNPLGTVGLGSSEGSDAFGGACLLTPSTSTASTCTSTVTASNVATSPHTITATYPADAVHSVSNNTASLTVKVIVGPPAATMAFNPSSIQPGGTSALNITITNPAANSVALTGLAFTVNFPIFPGLPPKLLLAVATPGGLTNTCGGTATAADGSSSVSLVNGTVAANSSCTVSVNVTSRFTGSYVISLGPVSSNAGNSNSPSATLNVAFPPTISKLFLPTTITAGGTSLLSFTINNPNSNSMLPNNDMVLTGIQFTDALPAGVAVASPNQLSNNCDGTVTAVPGSGSITLVGGDLGAAVQLRPRGIKTMSSPGARGVKLMSQPSASGSCFISVEVTAPAAGTFNNTTGAISANESGAGVASNTATLTVQAAPIVNPPTVSKAFGAPSFALNGTTSLTFTIANPNPQPLVNILLNDPLPAGLVIANPSGLTDVPPGAGCMANSAVVFANPGSHNVNMVGLVLPANASCSYSVNVTGVTSGLWVNTTNPITATFNDGSDNFVGITGGSAAASVVVELPPSISKAFSPALIAPNGVSTLIFTITNPAVNPVAESGVAFTDMLPGSLVVATPSGATGNCGGGTFTAVAGTTSISLTGGTIGANSSCTLSVNVTGAVTSTVTNTTSPVSSTNGGTGNTASATLSIKPANLSITKTHNGDFHRRETGTYTITVSNDPTAGPTLGTVTVVDTLPVIGNPHNLVPTAISGAGWTCTLATLTCTRSDALAPGASYPPISLTVDVPQNITANVVNSATVAGGGDPNTHEADDPTHIGPPLNVSPMDLNLSSANLVVPAGGSGSFMLDVESSKGLGMVTLSCSGLPTGGACSFSPAETNKLSTIVTMTITVPPRSASASPLPLGPGSNTYALLFPALGLLGIVFVGREKTGKKNWKLRLLGLAGAAMLMALASCGGAPQSMTPPQQPLTSYQVAVTASAGTVTSSTAITLNVR